MGKTKRRQPQFDPKPYEPYEKIDKETLKLSSLMNSHFSEVLNSVVRKLTEKEKFKNAWQIQVERTIHNSIFNPFYKAVRDNQRSLEANISP